MRLWTPAAPPTKIFPSTMTTPRSGAGPLVRIDEGLAVSRLMDLLRISAPTGEEKAVADHLVRLFRDLGLRADQIRVDDSPSRIPLPCDTGNLIVSLPGTLDRPRWLLSAHMDTVPLARGAVPVLDGGVIRPQGTTALGGDDRTGVAALVTAIAELLRSGAPHRPLIFLFSVREESGLRGAAAVRLEDLGSPAAGFNFDGGSPAEVTIGATGAARMDITVHGVAAHAGVHPERGVSAVAVLAGAVAELERGGWLGLIRQVGGSGTSNIGAVEGGEATNVVLDRLVARAEARSHDRRFLDRILGEFRAAFERAAAARRNEAGASGSVEIEVEESYPAFRIDEQAPPVRAALGVLERLGIPGRTRISNGGLDANWLTHRGVPTVTLGCGQREIHTQAEYVVVEDYLTACRAALALALDPSA